MYVVCFMEINFLALYVVYEYESFVKDFRQAEILEARYFIWLIYGLPFLPPLLWGVTEKSSYSWELYFVHKVVKLIY